MTYGIKKSKKDKFGSYRFIGVERNLNGSFTIDDGKNKKTYYGYSENEAVVKFKKEFK
jgi:hypothetical protein